MALIPNNRGQEIALDAKTGRATQSSRTVYLALLTAAPTATTTLATMSEVSTSGYARQSVAWAASSGNPRSTSNTGALTFGPFTADPPNITHCALVSASSGTTGDLIDSWSLDTARDGITGDSLTVAVGALVLTQT